MVTLNGDIMVTRNGDLNLPLCTSVCVQQQKSISLRYSSNFEAKASKLLEYLYR